jgi:hypothetical protein
MNRMKVQSKKLKDILYLLYVIILISGFFLSITIFSPQGIFYFTIIAFSITNIMFFKELIEYKTKKINKNEKGFFNTFLIIFYIGIYSITMFIKDYNYIHLNPQYIILIAKILFGSHFLFAGLLGLKTGRGWLRGAPLDKSSTRFFSILTIIFSVLIWIFPWGIYQIP